MNAKAGALSAMAALLLAGPVALAGESIWIEGEAPASSNYIKHNWYDNITRDVLSGRNWLSHYGNRSGEAAWVFNVAGGGKYVLWLRCNYFRAEMQWRLDGKRWTDLDLGSPRDKIMTSQKPDHRFIGWVKVGSVDLPRGRHTIEFRIHSKLSNHGGIDCMVFTNEPFVPSGATKPGEGGGGGPDEWYPVVVDDDEFSKDSVIDMSHLVHKPAGKFGFLKRRGDDLKFERSPAPVKFWGCGGNISDSLTREQTTQRIRYLVKHGVNMIRQHPLIGYLGPLRNGKLDAAKLDKWDWWFAELRKHGIYMTWSVFYPHHAPMLTTEDGYPPELFAELKKGRGGLGNVGGLINIERGIQDACLRYIRELLNHKNPYTGLKYRDDPALAVLEIQNEDCIFFHVPLNQLRNPKEYPLHSARFRKMWFGWIKKAYGSEAAVRKAWGGLRPKDSWARGEFELMGAYHLGADGPLHEYKGQTRRAGDFIRFCTELQKGYYDRREREMRTLGFKGVTVTTAWRSGGAAADPANIYCDTACDMIDRHNYFGGGAGGHGIRKGKVNNGTHLGKPGSGIVSVGFYQVEDRPFAITEWTVLPPNEWKAEIAPLFALYGMGLQGWDASYHFLNSHTRLGDGWPGLSSYCTDTPHYIGQFPALALAIHKGHIKEAPVAAARRLKTSDLFMGVDPLNQDFIGGGWDAKALKGNLATPTEVFGIGRVTVAFDGKKSAKADWDRYWDKGAKVVRSMTGDLTWDYGRRIVTVHSKKTQGVIGFAGGTRHDLPGLTVTVDTPFVSMLFTPLDDKDLKFSKHILITALARDKQTGTTYGDDGKRLDVVGGPPLLLEPVKATITLKGLRPKQVNVLDFFGVPTGKKVKLSGATFTIDGTHRTYYYEVKR